MKTDFDVAIIGSGFSGSLLAMIARRLGRSVVMIERGTHPRFAIGESSTPLANLLLEEIAANYDLPRLRPLCEWGSWRKSYPEIACGLKRGFTFYHHRFDEPWSRRKDRANELLVAASPHDQVADTHWYRADFDAFLAREAQALGVDYLDQTELSSANQAGGRLQLEGKRGGRSFRITARLTVDGTGPRGFLHRAFALGASAFPDLPPIEGLYSHFEGVRRWDEMMECLGNPYPADDAAVHHVFPGGWIWVLRFNNGIVSAGVAAAKLQQPGHEDLWQRLLNRLPAVRDQFAQARAVMPFIHASNLPFRTSSVAGENWALMPSAAGFIDPLLSTGFPLTLLGVQRLGRALERFENLPIALKAYEGQTLLELDAAARLIGALYRAMERPAIFNALTLLYFAAASYTECARRLRRPEIAGNTFLLGEHPNFAPAFHHCTDLALSGAEPQRIIKHVLAAIEPIDIAGLSDFSRRNSYGVFASDLRRAAGKLRATEAEIDEMLSRCGFVAN